MISGLNSNINFKGTVHLGGQTRQQKEQLAKTINTFETQDQNNIISGLNKIKGILEPNTPDEDTYEVHFNHDTTDDDFCDALELSVEKDGAILKSLRVDTSDMKPENGFIRSFNPDDKSNTIKRIFSIMTKAMQNYTKEVDYKPQEESNIETILNKLG